MLRFSSSVGATLWTSADWATILKACGVSSSK